MMAVYSRKIKAEVTQRTKELRLQIKEPIELAPDDVVIVSSSYDRSLFMPEFSVFIERDGKPLEDRTDPDS